MIVLGSIVAVLVLILLLPVGAYARYDGETLVRLIAGPFRIQILPQKPKTRKQLEKQERKKAKKAAKKAEQKKKAAADKLVKKDPPPEKPKEPLGEKIRGLLPFARLAADALGSVFRRLKVKNLTVHVRLAGEDPSKLADTYAKTMAAIWATGPILGQKFSVRHTDVSVKPDFLAEKSEILAVLEFHYLVFDLVGIALKYGFRGLRLLLQKKKQEKQLRQEKNLPAEGHITDQSRKKVG